MKDGFPEVSDFEFDADTPRCPKCNGPMDLGQTSWTESARLKYEPSASPNMGFALQSSARMCLECGYVEFYCNALELRCALAGIKPPKRPWF